LKDKISSEKKQKKLTSTIDGSPYAKGQRPPSGKKSINIMPGEESREDNSKIIKQMKQEIPEEVTSHIEENIQDLKLQKLFGRALK